MQKIEQSFAKRESQLKGWACVDAEVGVVGIFDTREQARNNKRYAEMNGHKQKVAKLTFEEWVR